MLHGRSSWFPRPREKQETIDGARSNTSHSLFVEGSRLRQIQRRSPAKKRRSQFSLPEAARSPAPGSERCRRENRHRSAAVRPHLFCPQDKARPCEVFANHHLPIPLYRCPFSRRTKAP